jgi:hypothetical protein
MSVSQECRIVSIVPQRRVNWRGRSGHLYSLAPERLDTLSRADSGVHMLARGTVPLWVGSSLDVINDPPSRSRFRLALEAADRAFLVDAEADELNRMTMVWDLEGAEPVSALSAA